MFNFFVDSESQNQIFTLTGANHNHAVNVLRLKLGDKIIISHDNKSHLCEVQSIEKDSLKVKVVEYDYINTTLPIEITLFQGLPKSDKLELIIQKAVELGASKIVPVEMQNSVVKIEEKKKESKTARWQAIAESAAKQCKSAFIPQIEKPLTFSQALKEIENYNLFILPYENALGMQHTLQTLKDIKSGDKVAVMIGPEGGFSQEEIEKAKSVNAKIISLGKRILRTETAAITTLSMLMLHAEINLK